MLSSQTNLKTDRLFLSVLYFTWFFAVFETVSEKQVEHLFTAADRILIFLISVSSSFLLSKCYWLIYVPKALWRCKTHCMCYIFTAQQKVSPVQHSAVPLQACCCNGSCECFISMCSKQANVNILSSTILMIQHLLHLVKYLLMSKFRRLFLSSPPHSQTQKCPLQRNNPGSS